MKGQIGTTATNIGLSSIQIGTSAHSWFDTDFPEPPRMTEQDWKNLKTESKRNPDAVLDYLQRRHKEQMEIYKKWTDSFNAMAKSLSEQVKQAEKEAEDAKRDAASAKRLSILSLCLDGIAIVISIIALM